MGIGVIVHGFIESVAFRRQAESRRVYRHNRAVIRRLPEIDEDWPFFTRSVFSLLPLSNRLEVGIPQFDYLVIAFGASYRNMHVLDAAWIRKFEMLLSRLCWDRAAAFVEFSAMRYDWRVDSDHQRENILADPPRPPRRWALECKRLSALDVPLAGHIEGHYVPVFEENAHG